MTSRPSIVNATIDSGDDSSNVDEQTTNLFQTILAEIE
jgi:hypothetical protein